MDASLETLVVAAYVFACSLSIPRPGPSGKVTDQELIALAVAQAVTGICSDRQFLGVIGPLLPGFFPELPGQSQYNRRLRGLTPQITTAQMMVAELIADGQVRLVDGTLIACTNYPGCASFSEFAGYASYGYCPSKNLFVWGMRLVLISDAKGVPIGYDLTGPKTGQERERALELAAAHASSTLFADKGFWGKEYRDYMELIDVKLITPERHRHGPRPASENRQGTRTPGHRERVLQPQAPDAPRSPPRQDTRRARAAHRTTPTRTHPRNPHKHSRRTPTPSPRRLRRTTNPHQASSWARPIVCTSQSIAVIEDPSGYWMPKTRRGGMLVVQRRAPSRLGRSRPSCRIECMRFADGRDRYGGGA